ncbi:MAG: hypothetical protein JO263_04395, partial [Candidatus Eremiobacteraeota bacterium]|nr:hypothetical protein [Candidatus Eremiobacteraeota bacterium]
MTFRLRTLAESAICAALPAVFLAACGGGSGSTLPARGDLAKLLSHEKTFSYTGKPQLFKVPQSVTTLVIDALGASGAAGGLGARVRATIPVTPGETLTLYVGGAGNAGTGGYNGGANGGPSIASSSGYGGGGASDVREGGTRLT